MWESSCKYHVRNEKNVSSHHRFIFQDVTPVIPLYHRDPLECVGRAINMYRRKLYIRNESKSLHRFSIANITKYNGAGPVKRSGYIRKYLSFSRAKWGRVALRSRYAILFADLYVDPRTYDYIGADGGWKPGKYLLTIAEVATSRFLYTTTRGRGHSSWGRALKRRHRSIDRFSSLYTENQLLVHTVIQSIDTMGKRVFFHDKITSSDAFNTNTIAKVIKGHEYDDSQKIWDGKYIRFILAKFLILNV